MRRLEEGSSGAVEDSWEGLEGPSEALVLAQEVSAAAPEPFFNGKIQIPRVLEREHNLSSEKVTNRAAL